MQNTPELDGKYLGTITKDFVKVAHVIKEASYQIIKRKISKHPIFVISKEIPEIGQCIIQRDKVKTDWNYNLSFLDEFIERGLIAKENEQEFISSYRSPEEYCCLFVVEKEFLNFIYIPYPENEDEDQLI